MDNDRGKRWRKEIRELSDEQLFWELQKETWDWREDVRNEVLCRILGRLISPSNEGNSDTEDLACEEHQNNWHLKCNKCFKNYVDYMEQQRNIKHKNCEPKLKIIAGAVLNEDNSEFFAELLKKGVDAVEPEMQKQLLAHKESEIGEVVNAYYKEHPDGGKLKVFIEEARKRFGIPTENTHKENAPKETK